MDTKRDKNRLLHSNFVVTLDFSIMTKQNYFLSKQVILDENMFQMLCVVTVPVIVKPSSIARDNDMMGLFSDIILMKI